MTLLIIAGATALAALIPVALIILRDGRRTPPTVPPAHPRRRATITVLDQTGEQVDRTVFPDPRR